MLPAVFGEVLDRRDLLQAGVVHEDVDAAPRASCALDERTAVVARGHVGALRDRIPERRGDAAQRGFVDVGEQDTRAARREILGDRATDTARRTGDERGLAAEVDADGAHGAATIAAR